MLVYLLATLPVASAVATLVALADRSHRVEVRSDAGSVTLVLHHEGWSSAQHLHGVMVKAITLLALQPVPAHPDHILAFAKQVTSEQVVASSSLNTVEHGQPGEHHFAVDSARSAFSLEALAYAVYARPPSADGVYGLLLSLRTTVLII